MKKILLFFSAVLVSATVSATLVTKDYNLSDLSKQQPSTTWSANSITVTTNNWDGIAHDYGVYPYNAEDYTELTLELASASEVGVNLWVTYSDNTTSNKTIEAGSLIARVALSSSAIKRIDIRLIAAGSATLSKLYFSKVVGKETPTNLYSGTYTFNWTWNDRIRIPNTAFASIHEGDRIQFTYTSGASGQCQVRVQELGDGANQLAETGEYAGITQSQAEPATFSFVLRAEDIEKVQTNGLYFHGNDYTVTSIDLYTYAQHVLVERTLNTGYKAVSWEGIFEHWNDIPTVYEGDELRATVVANNGSENYQLNFRYDWTDGHQLTPDVAVDGTVNKIYTKTLTAADAAAINATHDLLITGTGLTISRFAIAQSMSIYDDNMLWREETAVTTWGNPVSKSADKFANISVGDVINVTLSSVTAGGQLWMTKSDATPFTPKSHYIFNSNWVAPLTISYVVNQDMLTDLQAGGLLISGVNFTITSVHIIKALARQESYQLTVTSAGMATLVLPFNVPYLPDGVEAYELSNSGSSDIFATQVNAIEADKPVLIIASAGTYTFYSEPGANADISGKYAAVDGNYMNGALVGNYVQSTVPTTQPNTYNYVLQQPGEEAPAFYQVQDASCTVAPYRAYLSCGYPGNSGGGGSAPMRIVFRQQTPTDMEELTAESQQPTAEKVLLDGKLFIIRDGKTYDIFGRLVD